MKRIITLQHCQSEQHINGMMGGWNDWELTKLGFEQACRIGERLGAELEGQSVKIYSSDLKRAAHTAAPLAERLGVEVEYRKELREKNFGPAVMGKSKEWYREHCDNFGDNIDERCMPGAETKREIYERLMPLCEEMLGRPEDTLVLVSHGGALSVWNVVWLGLPPEVMNTCGIFGKAGAMGEFNIYEGWERRIVRAGDLSYIRD